MPTTYTSTELGGISVQRDEVDQRDAFSANVSLRQSPEERKLVFRDGGEFGSHEEISIAGQKLVSASQDGESVAVLDISDPFDPELLDAWGPDGYSDITDVEAFGENIAVPAKNGNGDNGVVVLDLSDPKNVSVKSESFDSSWGEFGKIGSSSNYDGISARMGVVVSEGTGIRTFAGFSNISSFGSADFGFGSEIKAIEIYDEYVHAAVSNSIGPLYQIKNVSNPLNGSTLADSLDDGGNVLKTLPDPRAGSHGSNFYAVNENGVVGFAAAAKTLGDVNGTASSTVGAGFVSEVDTSAAILRDAEIDRRHLISGGDKLLVHDVSDGLPTKTDERDLGFEIRAVENLGNLTVAAGDELAFLV